MTIDATDPAVVRPHRTKTPALIAAALNAICATGFLWLGHWRLGLAYLALRAAAAFAPWPELLGSLFFATPVYLVATSLTLILILWGIVDGVRLGLNGLNEPRPRFAQAAPVALASAGFVSLFVLSSFLPNILPRATQSFALPSSNMAPTLWARDVVLVDRRAHRSSEPTHGDVIVARHPKQRDVIVIGRVVGVGGDRIAIADGVLSINGTPVVRTPRPGIDTEAAATARVGLGTVNAVGERFPNGRSLETWQLARNRPTLSLTMAELTVPNGHIFLLGDNRDNSVDSRLPDDFGTVPVVNVVGRARLVIWGATWGRVAKPID